MLLRLQRQKFEVTYKRVDATLLTFQGMMGSLNWPQEEWKANMAEVDSMMFSMYVNKKKQGHFHKEKTHFQSDNIW